MNCAPLIKAIDAYIAKADDDLADELANEGYCKSKKTVKVINELEEEIAGELTAETDYILSEVEKPKNVLVNGSVAILIPKHDVTVSEKQMKYFSSDEYRNFYQIARNYQTRSLNVDACSVYFYGLLKEV